jgi:hypothetical protein
LLLLEVEVAVELGNPGATKPELDVVLVRVVVRAEHLLT